MAELNASMKKLLLIRHAKSDWSQGNLADSERTLNERGFKNAKMMAERLVCRGLIPQKVISSPAVRAKTTAELFCQTFEIPPTEIQYKEQVYEATSSVLMQVVNTIDDQYDFVALFGHNPGITNFIVNLCNSDIYNLPTCGMVLISFPFESWELISYETGFEKLYDYPKNKQ